MKKIPTLSQLKSLKIDFELFHKTLRTYGNIIIDFDNQSTIIRETYFEYKGNYFSTVKKLGEVISIGWEGEKTTEDLQTLINSVRNRLSKSHFYN